MALSIKSLDLNLQLKKTRPDGGSLPHPSNPLSTATPPHWFKARKTKMGKNVLPNLLLHNLSLDSNGSCIVGYIIVFRGPQARILVSYGTFLH